MIKDKIGIEDNVEIDRAHRLGGGVNAPIIAKFASLRTKSRCLGTKTN